MNTALFDLDPQALAASRSDKRRLPFRSVVSAQAVRLLGLLEQAEARSADLVIIHFAPNAAASLAAAKAADLILIPCRPAAFDFGAIGRTLNLVSVAAKPAFVMLNVE